jgi:hypothetical protein
MRTGERGWEPDDYIECTISSARRDAVQGFSPHARAGDYARWADDRLHGALCAERDGQDGIVHIQVALVEALLAIEARLDGLDDTLRRLAER